MKRTNLLQTVMGITLAAMLLVGCNTSTTSSVSAQPTATPIPPTAPPIPQHPSSRGGYALAYDSESNRVILFGGSNSADINDDTWAYDVDSNTWSEMKPASTPGAAVDSAIAYDAESDRVILFGGTASDQSERKGTWAYDFNTNTWTEMQPLAAPLARTYSRMVYDAESDRVILFGGISDFFGNGNNFNDTWAYDFNSNTWTEMKPDIKPAPRFSHQLAYDAESDRVIMWGGNVPDKNVWAYDYNANSWEELESGNGPESFLDGAMAYDAAADRVILHKDLELWTYDYNNNAWLKLELTPNQLPGLLSYHSLVYHHPTGRMMTFGGGFDINNFTDETWLFDLNKVAWTNP